VSSNSGHVPESGRKLATGDMPLPLMATHMTSPASWGEVGRTFLVALPAIALPFVIRAAVVGSSQQPAV
jgi:hypothetical protein